VIIPTYDRRELVQRAIDSVLAQTREVAEIIVVDDGSTDGTGNALSARYGNRIRYVRQENAGVSAARNRGLALANGRFLALLDSDDIWMPEKTERQVAWLEAHPDFGMVVCDVLRTDADRNAIDRFRRREQIREDGWALCDLLRHPALVPASAMLRHEVYEDVGGFDTTLATAEDLDFHLRVARRWKIGVVEDLLVEAMRGHDGLSSEDNTYDDYVRVVERAVAECAGVVDERTRREALALTYDRNARGMLIRNRWRDAWVLAWKAWRIAPDTKLRVNLLRLAPFALRRLANTALRR
jgi:glycosyltransferase involved in cell wall biosynthesis